MRTAFRLVVLALTSALAALVLTTPASAATTPYCGLTWGSLAKSAGSLEPTTASLTDVRAGRHTCYDRLVVDLANAPSWVSYSVSYTTVRGVGTGDPIPVAGGAALQITLRAHGESSGVHLPDVSAFRTFRQVVSGGSFEGVTVYGLGVRARLPFRVLTLTGPAADQTRLVIDVAHAW